MRTIITIIIIMYGAVALDFITVEGLRAPKLPPMAPGRT